MLREPRKIDLTPADETKKREKYRESRLLHDGSSSSIDARSSLVFFSLFFLLHELLASSRRTNVSRCSREETGGGEGGFSRNLRIQTRDKGYPESANEEKWQNGDAGTSHLLKIMLIVGGKSRVTILASRIADLSDIGVQSALKWRDIMG